MSFKFSFDLQMFIVNGFFVETQEDMIEVMTTPPGPSVFCGS